MRKILFLLGFLPATLFAQNISNFSGIVIEPTIIGNFQNPKIFENKNLYTINTPKNFDQSFENSGIIFNSTISQENNSSSSSFSSSSQSSTTTSSSNSSTNQDIIQTSSSSVSSFDQCARENIDNFRQEGKNLVEQGNQKLNSLVNDSNLIGKYLSVAKYCRQNHKNCETEAKNNASKMIENIKNYEKVIFEQNKKVQDYNDDVNYKGTVCKVGILPIYFVGDYSLSYTGNTNFDKKNIETYINKITLKSEKSSYENYLKNPSIKNLDSIQTEHFLNIMKQVNDQNERKIFKDNQKRK